VAPQILCGKTSRWCLNTLQLQLGERLGSLSPRGQRSPCDGRQAEWVGPTEGHGPPSYILQCWKWPVAERPQIFQESLLIENFIWNKCTVFVWTFSLWHPRGIPRYRGEI
jgi:hypothetical protein